MGRTALYRDAVADRPARAMIQLEADAIHLAMPDGGSRRHVLDGAIVQQLDGYVASRDGRRFVRMLILEHAWVHAAVITPPDQGAVAPTVVRLPEAPSGAAVIDTRAWDALSEFVMSGGRLAGCSIADLARFAAIATPQFAVVIGEVCAQRALELAWVAAGPLRGGGGDPDAALQPLVDAAQSSQRAAEALVSALAHVAGAARRRRR